MTRIALAFLTALAGLGTYAVDLGSAQAQTYYRAHRHRHQHYQGPYYRPHSRVNVILYPKGLYFGAGLVATRILDQKGGAELLDNGAGLTLYTGLRVNRHLALEAGWLGTLHNPERVQTAFGPDTDYLVMSGLTADAKVFVGNSTPNFEPFVQGGVGLYLVGRDSIGTESVGTGFQVGGGFIYRAGDHVELGIRALYRGMAMGPPEGLDNDTFVSALSMEGNLGFRF